MADVRPALRYEDWRQCEDQHADRHVDEEDPFPAEVLGQNPAEEDPGRGARAAESSPDPERFVSLGPLLEGRAHDRERGRRDDRCADSLHRAGRDQDADVPGQPAEERCDSEERQPDEEDQPSSEQIGHPATEEQETSERDRVGDQHPLHRRGGGMQFGLDRRDRDVDDRHVEDGHEERRPDDSERQPAARIRFGGNIGHVQPSLWKFTFVSCSRRTKRPRNDSYSGGS